MASVPGILLEGANRPHRVPGVHLVKQRGLYGGPSFIGASNSGAEVAEKQRWKQTSRIKIGNHNCSA